MKYLIRWNAGCGDSFDVIDEESQDHALDFAYDSWKEEVERNGNADYEVLELTEELAKEHGFEDELEDN